MHSLDVTTTTASNTHLPVTQTPMFNAAVRLGAFLSLVAAVLVLALASIVEISATGIVATVAGVGFATSWVVTGRFGDPQRTLTAHRVAVVPLPHRV